jgi:hypothetical protein
MATYKKLRCVAFEAEFVDADKADEVNHKYLKDAALTLCLTLRTNTLYMLFIYLTLLLGGKSALNTALLLLIAQANIFASISCFQAICDCISRKKVIYIIFRAPCYARP